MAMFQQGDKVDQLCFCVCDTLLKPFYITILSLHGNMAKVQCVDGLTEGLQLHVLPLESEEEAAGLDANKVREHMQAREAAVIRRESASRYLLRISGHMESHRREQVRTGTAGAPALRLEEHEAGPVTTIVVQGELAVTTSARLSDKIKSVSRNSKLILVDICGVTMLASIGIGMLVDGYKAAKQNGAALALLLDPQNPVVAVLGTTRLTEIIPTFTTRDEAVAMLLTSG